MICDLCEWWFKGCLALTVFDCSITNYYIVSPKALYVVIIYLLSRITGILLYYHPNTMKSTSHWTFWYLHDESKLLVLSLFHEIRYGSLPLLTNAIQPENTVRREDNTIPFQTALAGIRCAIGQNGCPSKS